MRYPASEKLEIIRIVEGSHQSVKHTLEQIGVSRPTFYRWYDLYRRFGEAALEDRRGGSGRVWNRIPEDVRAQMLDMALVRPRSSRKRPLRLTQTYSPIFTGEHYKNGGEEGIRTLEGREPLRP